MRDFNREKCGTNRESVCIDSYSTSSESSEEHGENHTNSGCTDGAQGKEAATCPKPAVSALSLSSTAAARGRRTLSPEEAAAMLRDDTFQPGPRPRKLDGQGSWIFKETPTESSQRERMLKRDNRSKKLTGDTDIADRWHNSGGSKNSRSLPRANPLVMKKYGSIERDGTILYAYHEYRLVGSKESPEESPSGSRLFHVFGRRKDACGEQGGHGHGHGQPSSASVLATQQQTPKHGTVGEFDVQLQRFMAAAATANGGMKVSEVKVHQHPKVEPKCGSSKRRRVQQAACTALPDLCQPTTELPSTGGVLRHLRFRGDPCDQNDDVTVFVDFEAGTRHAGAIVAARHGLALQSTGGDFAEFHSICPSEKDTKFAEGDIVGVVNSCISRSTASTAAILGVITRRACVAGSAPGDAASKAAVDTVAYCGRVPVRLRGPAATGDLVHASGHDDGTGTVLAPGETNATGVAVGAVLTGDEITDHSVVRLVEISVFSPGSKQPTIITESDQGRVGIWRCCRRYERMQQQKQDQQASTLRKLQIIGCVLTGIVLMAATMLLCRSTPLRQHTSRTEFHPVDICSASAEDYSDFYPGCNNLAILFGTCDADERGGRSACVVDELRNCSASQISRLRHLANGCPSMLTDRSLCSVLRGSRGAFSDITLTPERCGFMSDWFEVPLERNPGGAISTRKESRRWGDLHKKGIQQTGTVLGIEQIPVLLLTDIAAQECSAPTEQLRGGSIANPFESDSVAQQLAWNLAGLLEMAGAFDTEFDPSMPCPTTNSLCACPSNLRNSALEELETRTETSIHSAADCCPDMRSLHNTSAHVHSCVVCSDGQPLPGGTRLGRKNVTNECSCQCQNSYVKRIRDDTVALQFRPQFCEGFLGSDACQVAFDVAMFTVDIAAKSSVTSSSSRSVMEPAVCAGSEKNTLDQAVRTIAFFASYAPPCSMSNDYLPLYRRKLRNFHVQQYNQLATASTHSAKICTT
eukprot:SAG31_NODE_147_length_22539_cov_37.073663_2_plen_980_part_00